MIKTAASTAGVSAHVKCQEGKECGMEVGLNRGPEVCQENV